MSRDVESRTILLGSIGRLDENDLREHYQCLETSPGEKVVEGVFVPEGQDSALVIFTHEKFVAKALNLDHGDIEVTRPPIQMFSSVSATVHERIPRVVDSPTIWQNVVKEVKRQYGVDIHDLVIQGSWLQVEISRLVLMKIYTEYLTRDGGNREDHASSHSRERCAEAYTDVPWKTYEVASTRVHVHEGDITKMNVDVIVNAANRWLDHGGGVAEAIAWAAGPEFTQECHRIIRQRGEIDDGDGVMTSSGRLPCRKVYHVVGPMWHDYENKNDCLDILRQAFTNCLMASKDYTSIAIPAISSGIFGVPSELVAQTMCEAVTKFCCGEEHHSRLGDIHLVDINTAMVKLLQENFEQQSSTPEENSQFLREHYQCLETSSVVTKALNLDHGDIEVTRPPIQMFSSVSATVHERVPRAVASPTVWQNVVKDVKRQYGVDIHDLVIQGSWLQVKMCRLMLMKIYTECLTRDGGNRDDHASSHSREHCAEAFIDVLWKTYEVASTRVHVHEGDITKMNVDVIVNAANGRLVHGFGVAGAIAWAAGPDFTQECYRIIQERGEIDDGDGVMTSSGRLPCRKVYHVVGPVWNCCANKNDILHQTFTSCLMASKTYTSIAIPAVSSGIFGVPSELVARTMCEAVTKFCHRDAHQSRLRDIHLVDINTAMVKLLQENFELQSSTSEENSHKSARMASILSGVTGMDNLLLKGLGDNVASTTKESVLDECPFESFSPESPLERSEDESKCKRSSSSGGTDTDKKNYSVVMSAAELASSDGSDDSPWKRPDNDWKHRISSTSSLSDTDNKKGDVKSASSASPSGGDADKLVRNTSVGRSPSESENRIDDDERRPPSAKDRERESYAAVAQGGTTGMTKKQAPDIGGVAGTQCGAAAAGEGDGLDGGDPCPICLEMPVKPKILGNCEHKFCEVCINKCFDHKRECPVCRTVYGMLQGNQPKSGTMHSTTCGTALPGYTCRTIVIEYSFPDGTQTREHPHPGQPFYGTHRTAYLPDNQDGRRILDLLKRAFSQRLTFTVGRSVTTGQDNVVTWNDIHHKTSQYGGPDGYGYPDEGYLQRVTEDLAAKGIK